MNTKDSKVLVVGAGLAGCEAALFLAKRGIAVTLCETKNVKRGPAQKSPFFGELVCTNSLKSMQQDSPHGMLKFEMEALGSEVLAAAKIAKVPAGDALAVDREQFGQLLTEKIKSHPCIKLVEEEITDPLALAETLGADFTIVATGPLPTEGLEQWLQKNITNDDLYFYDAIAPVVDGDSLNMEKLYFKDRHYEGEGDYLNIPLNKDEYLKLIDELVRAEKVAPKDFEEAKFFEACLPIDLMAERGVETARFSCMKPIGLELPDGRRPYAVIQLRKENLLGHAFNLVGFQTRLTYKEQSRIWRMIPGLEDAVFLHMGSVHRNTFLNARKYLNFDLSSKEFPRLHFAGQMTGVEGYTESAACGLYAATQVYRKILNQEVKNWPWEMAIGALINYLMTSTKPSPSNINTGLFPEVDMKGVKGRERKKIKRERVAARARLVASDFIGAYLP